MNSGENNQRIRVILQQTMANIYDRTITIQTRDKNWGKSQLISIPAST